MKTLIKVGAGRLTVSLCGELDHHSAKESTDEILDGIDTAIPRELVLDMSKLSFMDSSGIALIMRSYRRMTEYGGRLMIQNPQQQPYKVMEAAGIFRNIEITSGGEVLT